MQTRALSIRERRLVQAIWRFGPQSRKELHERLGLRLNTVGKDTDELIRMGVLTERQSRAGRFRGRGRPGRPLEIDDEVCRVVGVAMRPRRLDVARLSLTGRLVGRVMGQDVDDPGQMMAAGVSFLRACIGPDTVAVGISTPGFVNPAARSILFSALWAGRQPLELKELYEASKGRPVALENDMHALAAQWLLSQRGEPSEDVLLVYIDDGQLGAALLVGGRPNRGCISAANELGHTRLPVATERCYCGQRGCIERIVSTVYAQGRQAGGTLAQRLTEGAESGALRVEVQEMMGYLGLVLANAVNFTRVHRLVLAGPLGSMPALAKPLSELVRRQLLPVLAPRVTIDAWDYRLAAHGVVAGWLALTQVLLDSWD